MTQYNLAPVGADSFTGAITAIEGIRDAAVLLNGPTGCKFYHSALAENQISRSELLDPLYYSEEFYFGQPRVPATYLDDYDYVFGATAKLEKILPVVAAKGHRLIAIINSPGAALIGDDLQRFIAKAALPVPCIAIESCGFSEPVADGFQRAAAAVINRLCQPAERKEKEAVNLIGLSIFHYHWQGNLIELTRLLNACGITVNCCLCAGCTTTELKGFGNAALNVIICEEYADQLTPLLAEKFALKTLRPAMGAPIGFTATESWLTAICDALDKDPAPALALLTQARRQSHNALNRFNALTGLPKGVGFSIDADASSALPLCRWLYHYLGMIPLSIEINQPDSPLAVELQNFLDSIGCENAWQKRPEQQNPQIIFASGATIFRVRLKFPQTAGIPIALPGDGYLHVIDKATMGAKGALYLIERIINCY